MNDMYMENNVDISAIVVKSLRELGFELEEYGPSGYLFELEGLHFIYVADNDDAEFLQIAVPAVFEISDENADEVHALMQKVTADLKFIKALQVGNYVWLSYEHYLMSTDNIKGVLTHMIYMLQHSFVYFNTKINDGWDCGESVGSESQDCEECTFEESETV